MAPKIVRGTSWPKNVRKTVTFTGGAGNGAVGFVDIFDVTGEVLVTLVPFCSTGLTEGGATAVMGLGVTGNTGLFITTTTEPEDVDTAQFWQAIAPIDVGGVALLPALKDILVSADIIVTIGNDSVATGVLEFTCLWTPLSPDGLVVPA